VILRYLQINSCIFLQILVLSYRTFLTNLESKGRQITMSVVTNLGAIRVQFV